MSALRLDHSRTQLLGSAAIVSVVALWAVALPLINSMVEGENPFKSDEPYSFSAASTIVPAQGWARDPASDPDVWTILRKGEATLAVVAAIDSSGATIEASLQPSIDGSNDDASGTQWVVGPIHRFETDDDAPGGSVTAHSASDVTSTWVIDDGTWSVTAIGSANEHIWPQVDPEMEAMIRSIVLDAAVPPDEAQETDTEEPAS